MGDSITPMNLPTITGVIRRRVLLNYRISPDVVSKVLPAPFEPKIVHGHAVGGICLIRLEEIRPKGLPKMVGVSSENSAHRFAVEWDDGGKKREGVFVPRRDTNSQMTALAGGRIFPGVHHLSNFDVSDDGGKIAMRVVAGDTEGDLVNFDAKETSSFPDGSIFDSVDESSAFFEAGCTGYSSRPDSCVMDGLMLQVDDWQVSPLAVGSVRSAYFDDRSIFPEGEIAFDHALLMRDIDHEWHSQPAMSSES